MMNPNYQHFPKSNIYFVIIGMLSKIFNKWLIQSFYIKAKVEKKYNWGMVYTDKFLRNAFKAKKKGNKVSLSEFLEMLKVNNNIF